MITLYAAVERATPGQWLPLDGARTPAEVEEFVRRLAGYVSGDDVTDADPARLIDIVTTEQPLIVPGGLVATDPATGVSITPGCCAGLENWRDWWRILDGESPWLGHDPDPVVDFDGPARCRLRQDLARTEPYVGFTRAELAELLAGVQRDLAAFTGPLRSWAASVGLAGRADDLVAAYRRSFTP